MEEEIPCKRQVINDAQGQSSPQRISQLFVTLLKAIVSLLWLKFVGSLVHVSAMGACSPSSKMSCCFEKFRPDGYPIRDLLFHDNARPHSAALTQEKLAEMYWTALEHPLYSLDLSPCDYHVWTP